MSAYITQLDILGFDGSAAAWTQKVNAVETGGGGGAMSAAVFTLSNTTLESRFYEEINPPNPPVTYEYTWWNVDTAAFLSDRIQYYCDRRQLDPGSNSLWDKESNFVRLTVTSEYTGRFPDSLTFRFEGRFIDYLGEDNGIYLFITNTGINVQAYDINDVVLGSWEIDLYEVGYYPGGADKVIDSGSNVILLTYPTTRIIYDEEFNAIEIPYECPGLHHIEFSFSSVEGW